MLCDKADGSDGVVISYEMWKNLGQPITKSEYTVNCRAWLRDPGGQVQPNCKDCGMSDGMHVLSCPYPLGSKQALTSRLPKPMEKQRKGVKIAVEVLGYENHAGQRLETLQGKLHLLHRCDEQPTVFGYSDSVYYDVLCDDHVRPACTNCRYTYYGDTTAADYFDQAKKDLLTAVEQAAPQITYRNGGNTMDNTYIGDAERKEGIEHLRRAWMAGYLKEEEFIERSEKVDNARTRDEIHQTKSRLPDKLDQWAAAPAKKLCKIPAEMYGWLLGFIFSATIAVVPFVYIDAITHGTDGSAGEKAIMTVCLLIGLTFGVVCGGMGIESLVTRAQQRKQARRG